MRVRSIMLFALRSNPSMLKTDMVHAVITCATSRKFAGSSMRMAASAQMSLQPWKFRQSRILSALAARRCRPKMSMCRGQLRHALLKVSNHLHATLAFNPLREDCRPPLQADAALSAEQLRQSLRAAFHKKKWLWLYMLRMAMKSVLASLGRSLTICASSNPCTQAARRRGQHLRHLSGSQLYLYTSTGGVALRRRQGPAAWPTQHSRRD